MIEFCVFGKPSGKARPRIRLSGHAYNEKKTKTYEQQVGVEFIQAGGKLMPKGIPVGVEVTAYFQVPKSYTKRRKALCRENLELPLKTPDGDNILKIVCDALNGLAWKDDTQVAEMTVRKRYSKTEAFVRVRIWEVKP